MCRQGALAGNERVQHLVQQRLEGPAELLCSAGLARLDLHAQRTVPARALPALQGFLLELGVRASLKSLVRSLLLN